MAHFVCRNRQICMRIGRLTQDALKVCQTCLRYFPATICGMFWLYKCSYSSIFVPYIYPIYTLYIPYISTPERKVLMVYILCNTKVTSTIWRDFFFLNHLLLFYCLIIFCRIWHFYKVNIYWSKHYFDESHDKGFVFVESFHPFIRAL